MGRQEKARPQKVVVVVGTVESVGICLISARIQQQQQQRPTE